MRYRFNETNIATGLIKELLKEFNLPMYTVYTEGKPIYPGKLYIKNSTIYVGEGSGDSAELVPVNDYIYNQKQINMTKNLVINSSVYDSYTHTYLGNYLRFMRDYNRLNLMPLYNCFNTETLGGVNQFISLPSGNTFEINTYNTSNTYYLIPIKFNEQYTIAIDSPVTYELVCMIHTPSGLTDLSKELMADTYKKIPGSQFSSPYLFSTDFDATKYWSFENNLRLLIKLPDIASNSTITVLEGNYTASARCQNSIVSSFAIDDKNGFGIYPTRLSLLDMNDGVSYPFADRLLEYLSNNAIVPQEKITDNIGRLQRAVYNNSRFKGAYDIWDPQLRISLFNRLSDKTNKKNFYNIYREDAGNTPASKMSLLLGNTTQGANPSPSSPQAIHSVSGDNEIRVTGKNLLLNSDSFEGWEINNRTNISVENGIVTFNPQSKAWWCVEANKNMLRYSDINNPISVSVDLRSDANGTLNNGTVYVILAAFNSEGVRVGRYNIFILSSISGTWNRYIKSNISKSSISPIDSYTRADIENGYVGIQIYNNSLSNLQVTHPQLEVGSTATTYEPYKAQVYPINLPVENLTNASDIIAPPNVNSSNTRIGGDYSLTAGTYTLSWTISNTVTGTRNRPLYTVVGGSSVYCPTDSYTKGRHSWTFTLDTDTNIVMYWWYHTLSAECTISEFMLEKGTSTTYFPYGSPSIELNALGNYKDYFHKTDGKWYLHKAIDKVDMGTLTWVRRTTNIFGSSLPNGTDVTADISAHMSNYFPIQYVTGMVNTQINTIAIYKISNITSTTSVYVSLADIDTVGDLTTWFNSHATELYYPLATPTNTEITDATLISQLEELSKATGYDGETNIIQSNNDLSFDISNLEKILDLNKDIAEESKPIVDINENIKFIDTTPDLLSYGDKDVETFLGVARW